MGTSYYAVSACPFVPNRDAVEIAQVVDFFVDRPERDGLM
jgi:hypothetical protein